MKEQRTKTTRWWFGKRNTDIFPILNELQITLIGISIAVWSFVAYLVISFEHNF